MDKTRINITPFFKLSIQLDLLLRSSSVANGYDSVIGNLIDKIFLYCSE